MIERSTFNGDHHTEEDVPYFHDTHIESNGHSNGSNGSSGDEHVLIGDSSFSELVGRLRHEFPDALSVPLCEEILDWLKDQGLLSCGSSRRTFSKEQWLSKFIQILEYIFKNPSLLNIYAILYAHDVPLLDDIIGNLTPTEFAARLDVTRQAVNGPVLRAQKKFNLPPRKNQRTAHARQHMQDARIKQLTH